MTDGTPGPPRDDAEPAEENLEREAMALVNPNTAIPLDAAVAADLLGDDPGDDTA